MIWLYDLVLVTGVVVCAPAFALVVLVVPRWRRGFTERLSPLARSRVPSVWVHAASVGEAEAVAPLIESLLERGLTVRATTQTRTGRDRLRARKPGLDVRLMPLDLPGLMHWSARRARVSLLVLVETELWPNAIAAVRGQGGAVAIVSARISDRSFRRYRLLRPVFAQVLTQVDWLGTRSSEDRDRYLALGAPPARVDVLGDLKLDRPGEPPKASAELRAALGPGPLLVGGSTHPGEEEALLEAWSAVRELEPSLRCVLAPRHPERVSEVVRVARRRVAAVGLRSAGAAEADVVVLDTLGELGAVYTLASLVFVGGSLTPVGGHNLFEPIRAGRAVVHGPHIQNQRSQVALLEPLGVLHPVADAPELAARLCALWRDPERDAPARAARPVLEAHRGAIGRALAQVLALARRSARA